MGNLFLQRSAHLRRRRRRRTTLGGEKGPLCLCSFSPPLLPTAVHTHAPRKPLSPPSVLYKGKREEKG